MTNPNNFQITGPFTYVADGVATIHNVSFIQDPQFAKAYQAGISTIQEFRPNLELHWRVYTACWAAQTALRLEGDYVECGVNTGILSRAVLEYVQFSQEKNRLFWLLDTFSGIPVDQLTHNEKRLGREQMNNKYLHGFATVQQTFSQFDNVKLIQGRVPDTLPQVTSEKVAYLSIDMNAVIPEIAAANYFWDKLVPGGVMLLDDYGFQAHQEQKAAFDEFALNKGAMIYSSPTGQGIVIKP